MATDERQDEDGCAKMLTRQDSQEAARRDQGRRGMKLMRVAGLAACLLLAPGADGADLSGSRCSMHRLWMWMLVLEQILLDGRMRHAAGAGERRRKAPKGCERSGRLCKLILLLESWCCSSSVRGDYWTGDRWPSAAICLRPADSQSRWRRVKGRRQAGRRYLLGVEKSFKSLKSLLLQAGWKST